MKKYQHIMNLLETASKRLNPENEFDAKVREALDELLGEIEIHAFNNEPLMED